MVENFELVARHTTYHTTLLYKIKLHPEKTHFISHITTFFSNVLLGAFNFALKTVQAAKNISSPFNLNI